METIFNVEDFANSLNDNSDGALTDAVKYIQNNPNCLTEDGKKKLLERVAEWYWDDSFHIDGRTIEQADWQSYFDEFKIEWKSFLAEYTYSSWGECYYNWSFGEWVEEEVTIKRLTIKK